MVYFFLPIQVHDDRVHAFIISIVDLAQCLVQTCLITICSMDVAIGFGHIFNVTFAQHRNCVQSDILKLCIHKKYCLGANALISDHFSFEDNLIFEEE